MEKGFVYYFMAGIDTFFLNPAADTFELIVGGSYAPWCFGMAVVLGAAGYILRRERDVRVFTLIRHGSRKRWWKKHFFHFFIEETVILLLFWLILHGLDGLCMEQRLEKVTEISILTIWITHMLTLSFLFCLLDITKMGWAAPALLLTTEMLTYKIGLFHPGILKFFFGFWGMYVWSRPVKPEMGFAPMVILFVEIFIIIIIYRSGQKILKCIYS